MTTFTIDVAQIIQQELQRRAAHRRASRQVTLITLATCMITYAIYFH